MAERFRVPRNRIEGDASIVRTILWCEQCRFGKLWPPPTEEESLMLHSSEYFARYGAGGREARQRMGLLDGIRGWVAWRLDGSKPTVGSVVEEYVGQRARICDIGCGNGDLLTRLRDAGHEVVGVEPSDDARHKAKEKGLNVFRGTAESLPEAVIGGGFDVVIAVHVIEHCLRPLRALECMAALVRPGGVVICETPNFECLAFERRGPTWWHADIPRHVSFFTARSLQEGARKAGCRVEATEFRGFASQFRESWIRAEQDVWDGMYGQMGHAPEKGPVRPRMTELWLACWKAAWAEPRRKYQSVRVVARVDAGRAACHVAVGP